MPYVVESPALNDRGERVGTFRHWVATEERARSEAAKHPDRTYRMVEFADMPQKARDAMVSEH